MNASAKEIAKMLIVGFAVMMALPLAYRLWLMAHPEPEKPCQTLVQTLDRLVEDGSVRLLKTPIVKWCDEERRLEPQVHAWLTAHEKVVLPWEWTDEARRKDPDGFRDIWELLVEELAKDVGKRLKAEQKTLKVIDREISIVKTIHAHRTNQIARVCAAAATNSFPMTVVCERLEKGRFWGWNQTKENHTFVRREDLLSAPDGWLAAERQAARDEERRLGERDGARRRCAERIGMLQSLLVRAATIVDQAVSTNAVASQSAVRELLGLIKSK